MTVLEYISYQSATEMKQKLRCFALHPWKVSDTNKVFFFTQNIQSSLPTVFSFDSNWGLPYFGLSI